MSNELDEKFVSDDGISTAAEPVTPAGGAIAKKKADVKKSVDPKAAKAGAGTPGQGAAETLAQIFPIPTHPCRCPGHHGHDPRLDGG